MVKLLSVQCSVTEMVLEARQFEHALESWCYALDMDDETCPGPIDRSCVQRQGNVVNICQRVHPQRWAALKLRSPFFIQAGQKDLSRREDFIVFIVLRQQGFLVIPFSFKRLLAT